ANLSEEKRKNLRALGHSRAKRRLNGETKRIPLEKRPKIIQPFKISHRLQIGLVFDQLFRAAMQKPNMRIDSLDHLAVEFQNQPQHAVRRRMLRPEIDREIARCGLGHHAISATFAIFSANRALNLSHRTTKRSWRPSPIKSRPSCALTLKVTRGPTTATHSTSTVTVMPGGVAAR